MSHSARRLGILAIVLTFVPAGHALAQAGRPAIDSTGALGPVLWNDGFYTYWLNTDTRSIAVSAPGGGSWVPPDYDGTARLVAQAGGADLVVFDFTTFTVGAGVNVHVVGSLPAVIAASGAVTIAGTVLVENGRPGAVAPQGSATPPGGGGGGAGPGYYVLVRCNGFTCTTPVLGGGGGGGGGVVPGAAGAAGNVEIDTDGVAHQLTGGVAGQACVVPREVLVTGAGGGAGGEIPATIYGRGPGGAGGGALLITTPASLTIAGTVLADGRPGGDGTTYGGSGGGGGGGGMLVFQVGGTMQVSAGGRVVARGGAGGNSPGAPTHAFSRGGTGGGGLIEIDATQYLNTGVVDAGTGLVDVVTRTTAITGTIARSWGGALAGVTVTLDGFLTQSTTTDASGRYTFGSLARAARYRVTPALATYLMNPVSATVGNLQADTTLDFAGTRPTITATIRRLDGSPLAGVTAVLSGDATGTGISDATGTVVFPHVPYLGSFAVTPSRTDFVFTPPAAALAALSSSQTVEVVATQLLSLRGTVRDLNGSPVEGVSIALSGAASASAISGADGAYLFDELLEGRAFTLTATRPDFTFRPPAADFAALATDVTQDFLVASGVFVRYFAEGATSAFFDTRVALLNATPEPASTTVRFMTAKQQTHTVAFELAGYARVTIDPKQRGLANEEFATVVEASQPLIADRLMSWDARRYGSHAETSIATPLTTWYFAEGATFGGFDLFYLLLNRTETDAEVEIAYLLPAPLPPIVKTYRVPASSRYNVWVDLEDPSLAAAEVSAAVRSTNGVPIIAERAMYMSAPGHLFNAGHEGAGVAGPSTEWFLAEGATGRLFDLFILVANPGEVEAEVEAQYLRPSGPVMTRTYRVAPRSRFNIWVDLEDPELSSTAVSTTTGPPTACR